MTQTPSLKTQQMQIGGMDCASCAAKIETTLQKVAGVAEVSVSAATERLIISYDPQQVNESTLRDRITTLGYTIVAPATQSHAKTHPKTHKHSHDHHHDHHHSHEHRHDHHHEHSHGTGEFVLKTELLPVLTVVALLIGGMIFEEFLHNTPHSFGEYVVFIPAYLIAGWTVLKIAGRNILRGQVFDENFLMTIATVGAIAIHQLPEAVAVMLFYRFRNIR
jgi:Zn2+/Cd2+-exporting ATPase